jgi:hypothetical protein
VQLRHGPASLLLDYDARTFAGGGASHMLTVSLAYAF